MCAQFAECKNPEKMQHMYGLPRSRVAHCDPLCARARHRGPLPVLENAGNRRVCRYCGEGERCMICTEELARGVGVATGCHTVCHDCLLQHVEILRTNPQWDGAVRCPCGARQREIARLPPNVRDIVRAWRGATNATPSSMCPLQRAIDDVLTLKCPHCAAAFVDFEGCVAVRCRCGKFFCALCFEAYETNERVHKHVQHCRLNPTPGEYYVSAAKWNDLMRTRQIVRSWSHLEDVRRDTSVLMALTVARELHRHGAYLAPMMLKWPVAIASALFMLMFPRVCVALACVVVCIS